MKRTNAEVLLEEIKIYLANLKFKGIEHITISELEGEISELEENIEKIQEQRNEQNEKN